MQQAFTEALKIKKKQVQYELEHLLTAEEPVCPMVASFKVALHSWCLDETIFDKLRGLGFGIVYVIKRNKFVISVDQQCDSEDHQLLYAEVWTFVRENKEALKDIALAYMLSERGF